MIVTLERFAYSHMGVFGVLKAGPNLELYTVERPWLGNKPSVSCIPTGRYALAPTRFNRGNYDTFEVKDVPGRTQIKIHIGNTMNDLQGCIAPGTKLGMISGLWAVTNSREAFADLMQVLALAQAPHSILITDREGA